MSWKQFLLIFLGVLLLIFSMVSYNIYSSYKIESEFVKNEWNERFDRCISSIDKKEEDFKNQIEYYDSIGANKNSILNEYEEFKNCIDNGGCFTCGSCNSKQKLYFSTYVSNLIFGEKIRMCAAVCNYVCIYPSEYYN